MENVGGNEGIYTATLTIDGSKTQTKVIKVAPQTTEKILFTVTRDEPKTYHIEVNGLSTTFRLLKPAEFVVTDLAITPAIAEIGRVMTVTADVSNTGEVEGSYIAILKIDGVQAEAKDITITPKATERVSFTFSKDVAGLYCIEIAGVPRLLIVKDAQGLVYNSIVEATLFHSDSEIVVYDITYISDGLKVKGYLAQPKAPGTYPAIIWNRGGNREYGLLKPSSIEPYARNGYVAIGTQYRGNGGSEGREEFGGADVNDVLNLIPLLKSMPNVNANKIGMVGYSRGGMMTYIALKEQTLRRTDGIKAACTVGGSSDLFMTAKDRPDMLTNVLMPLIGGGPSEIPEEYEARSAVCWADKINVPLLIQHGEVDWRVSVEQAQKLGQELDKHGKVHKLITYPGDDHGLSGHNGGLTEILAWLDQYLK